MSSLFTSRRLLRNISLISLIALAFAYGASRMAFSSAASDRPAAIVASKLIEPAIDISASTVKGEQTAIFAGGCFWGVEAVFEHLKGVSDVVSGFSGVTQPPPTMTESVLVKPGTLRQ